MFEERPFRHQPHSYWSVWWFVGLMSAGLTAWHLELLPFLGSSADQLARVEARRAQSAPSEFYVSDTSDYFPPGYEPEQSVPAEQELLSALQRHEIPSSTMQSSIHEVGYQSAPIENSGDDANEPSHHADLQAQTLTYQAELKPVPPRHIPLAQGPPPVQTAGYSVDASSRQTIQYASAQQPQTAPATAGAAQNQLGAPAAHAVQTAQATAIRQAAAEPLDPAVERDILRLRELSTQYWQKPEMRAVFAPELHALAQKIYFFPETHYMAAHTVEPGDQLRLIARDYRVTWQYLARLNRTAPEKIRAGQEIKVLTGPFNAVVDLSDHIITVHAHGYYVCEFPIGTGRNDATPVGEFAVINKVENPTYYGPNGVIGANDPANPLGEHWIDLGNSIGIHGTVDPTSIGESVSKGCVRMHAADVALVYDLLTVESVVTIRP